jgi:hypothetical protein
MHNRIAAHLRGNVVAYLALFVALGGTGYAATRLPAGSVGSRALQNHSITPDKFNRQFINGTVRAWAVVNANGSVQEGAGEPVVGVAKGVSGSYAITWKKVVTPTERGCFALSGLLGFSNAGGSATALLVAGSTRDWRVGVGTYNAQGQRLAQSFYVALVC